LGSLKNSPAAVIAFISGSCACEIAVASSGVPQQVLSAFTSKYAGASDVDWEIEKEERKLYYEAEFKVDGKKKEAYFRHDGTFSKEEE
jgi:hypothetical protein